MEKHIISTANAPKAVGPYSQGIRLSNQKETFYFSGQLGINPSNGVMAEGVVEQTKTILKNISALLNENGMTAENVIKTLVFITDMTSFSSVNAEYSKFFTSNYPARSCVEVSKLPLNALVEIEVIAAK